jgi:hypothetical protein
MLIKMYVYTFLASVTFTTIMHIKPVQGLLASIFKSVLPASVLPSRVSSNDGLTQGRAYQLCTTPTEIKWFGVQDCLTRYSLVVLCFVWALLTSPVAFPLYTYRINKLWYGDNGIFLTIFYPILPLVMTC